MSPLPKSPTARWWLPGFVLGMTAVLGAFLAWRIARPGHPHGIRETGSRADSQSPIPTGEVAKVPRVEGSSGGTSDVVVPTDGAGDPDKTPPNPMRAVVSTAVQEMARESDPIRHNEVLEAALARVTPSDMALALAALTDPEFEKSGQELRRRLFERWGATDPRAAAQWAGRMSPGAGRAEAVGELARGWAGRDMDAARAWALQLPEASDRDSALIQVSYELARTRPVEALQLAIELQPTERRDELLNFSATQWASQKPQEAVEWASQVTDETLRTRLLRDVFTEWGDHDPMAAATAAVKTLPEGRAQNDTVVGIVQRWAQTEPVRAGAWVSAFPEGELRETAGRELVTIWADQSVEDAGNWLNGLERDSFRDVAVSAYVGKILPAVPDLAAVWVMEIADPVRRAEEMERVGAGWLESNATAARAWISQSSLSSEAKARLLSPPASPTPPKGG